MKSYDFAVIGGGIVGLATARALRERFPRARLLILEKESDWGRHQTGHNSGVIHSGIYYKPGSLKARLCVEGSRALVAFCQEHGLAYDICGKVIVATQPREMAGLETLQDRGQRNGLEVQRLSSEEVREWEPHVRCLGALRVPATGIVDFPGVCRKLAELLATGGAEMRTSTPLRGVVQETDCLRLETGAESFETRFLVNCAGLHSDRIARMMGVVPPAQIVPFRGEYYELRPERRSLVNSLIYPVPDPAFPFLGVHFTRGIDGGVHAGPNAVLGLRREGYRKTDFGARDLAEVLTYSGFWRLATRHMSQGMMEMARSASKPLFVRSLQRMIPEVTGSDVVPAGAGVRAQALLPDGRMVDDFLLVDGARSLHVLNAPSPAATASLEIGRTIAGRVSADIPTSTVSR